MSKLNAQNDDTEKHSKHSDPRHRERAAARQSGNFCAPLESKGSSRQKEQSEKTHNHKQEDQQKHACEEPQCEEAHRVGGEHAHHQDAQLAAG